MPGYIFSLVDDRPVDEFGGQILADDETASRVAFRLAHNAAVEVSRVPLDQN